MQEKKIKVAINGLGRIGRAFLKLALARKEIEIVAVNDLGDLANLAYLLKYDSAYGRSGLAVAAGDHTLTVDGHEIQFLQEKDPARLPWKKLDIDVVVESTGFFDTEEKAKSHLASGAKRVVISAPSDAPTVLMGLNEDRLKTCEISSNASCTTNAASPVIQIMHEALGVEKAMLSTVHAYTATQKLVDAPDAHDWRRGRAGAANIVLSSTGAAKAVTRAIPELEGLFDGLAMRVPVITGSIADLTFVVKRATSKEEVNEILKKAANEPRWKDLLEVTDDPIVSSDVVGNPHASVVDAQSTRVVGGDLVKVCAWYDNELGYTTTLVEHVIKAAHAA